MTLPGWVDWTNTGVGSVGVLLTIAALWQATSAKNAARMAAKTVQSHHAETDFIALARMTKELHGFIEHGHLPEAKVRMTDLRSEFSTSLQLHKEFLKSNWKLLIEQQYSLTMAANRLHEHSETLSQQERSRHLETTGAILEVLAGQSGKLGSSVERNASHE